MKKAENPRIIVLILMISIIFNMHSLKEIVQIVDETSSVDSTEVIKDSMVVDSVAYSGDSIHYSMKNEIIELSGNAVLKYHNSNLKADTIVIDMKKEQAFARGKAYMQDGDQNMLGENIFYDLDSEWGMVADGSSKFDKGFYYGDEIRKIDKNTFDVDDGLFTTCDAFHPHFYIKSKKLRLYKNDKIVAKPVIFYVNHFPIMMLPFGTFTIKRGRQSGILVPSPGWNKVNGKYIENIAYYYAYKDYADATFAFDYMEKTGWETSFRTKYIKRYIFNGFFNAVLQKRIETPQSSSYEWNIKSRHHHDFGNNTTFKADLNFVSSKRIWEGNESIDERLAEKITSSIAYKKPFLSRTLMITAKYVDDLENKKKDITLPSISFSLPSKPIYEHFTSEDEEVPDEIWWKNFSYSYNFKAVHQGDINDSTATFWDVIYKDSKDADSTYTDGNKHNAGIKHSAGLRYSYKLKGWLNLSQSVSANEVWFDRDELDNKFVRGTDYSARSSMIFNLYGLRKFPRFYVSAVRHIITPALSFSYQPDFSENEKYYSFGGIGLNSSDKLRKFGFSLGNKWQLKLMKIGNLKERKINDFFKINSSFSYDFESDNGFGIISHSLDMKHNDIQYKILDFSTDPSFSFYQDPYELDFKTMSYKDWDWGVSNWNFSLTSKLNFSGDAQYYDYFPLKQNDLISGDFFRADTTAFDEDVITSLAELDELDREQKNWSISFSHIYKTNKAQYEINDYSSKLRMSVSAKLTKKWSVSYDNYFDLKEDDLISHSFTITRNLHCWKVYFRYTKQGDYWNYRLQLFNIELPDALKFRTSDHKR